MKENGPLTRRIEQTGSVGGSVQRGARGRVAKYALVPLNPALPLERVCGTAALGCAERRVPLAMQ